MKRTAFAFAALVAMGVPAYAAEAKSECVTPTQVKAIVVKAAGKTAGETFKPLSPEDYIKASNAIGAMPEGTDKIYGATGPKGILLVAFNDKNCEVGMVVVPVEAWAKLMMPAPDQSKAAGTTDKLGRDHI